MASMLNAMARNGDELAGMPTLTSWWSDGMSPARGDRPLTGNAPDPNARKIRHAKPAPPGSGLKPALPRDRGLQSASVQARSPRAPITQSEGTEVKSVQSTI